MQEGCREGERKEKEGSLETGLQRRKVGMDGVRRNRRKGWTDSRWERKTNDKDQGENTASVRQTRGLGRWAEGKEKSEEGWSK